MTVGATLLPAQSGGPLHVGVIWWRDADGVSDPLSRMLRTAGCRVSDLTWDGDLPVDLDIVLIHGPMDSLSPLMRQLSRLDTATRPFVLLWVSEQLPGPLIPLRIQNILGDLRLTADRIADATGWSWLIQATQRGTRFRYLGDLRWLKASGYPHLIAIASEVTRQRLQQQGFRVIGAHLGVPPEWHEPQPLARDIPVLWLGKSGSRRRARLLDEVEDRLMQQGVAMLRVDGERHPFVFGEARTTLLCRSRIVLNLLRQPWDDNARRQFLAAANGALIVSEPMLPHTRFQPGVHYVGAPADSAGLTLTILDVLQHEDRYRPMVEAARQLCLSEYTMEGALQRVLNATLEAMGRTGRLV